ncbi:hypothetical protein [Heyndrickxia coagulans]|nr:hypothetical protein [Heyndrickxia coagulans]MCR2846572.1 hypothetical protein [Heyndrickxia coagulans]MDR4224247.1 hypothetical protein [Heyndrickxia coagulans DSM 1 = ATCC 7050]MED4495368.1 hypothetical protein [Heyndrickxia coagulans]MED4535274.1 hypothetical protein [Heyndrickxia coagulans]QJE32647.1 hypothetical protein HHU11_08575 [Heyndrickxia coagulans]
MEKKMKATKTLICLLSLLLLFLSAGAGFHPAFAKEKRMRIIIHDRHTVIPKNEKVENVVVIGNNATVGGYVKTAVIVINGNLNIRKSADIRGSVFVLGGNIKQQPGARVTEHVLSINMNNKTLDSMIFAAVMLLALWFFRLSASLLLIVCTVLFGLIAQKPLFSGIRSFYTRPGRMIITGCLLSLVVLALSLFLTITVVLIPVVLLLSLAVFVSLLAGLVFLGREIGSTFDVLNGSQEWLKLLTGVTILVALCSIPLVGEVIFLILFWYSIGLSVTWLFQKWRNRKKRADAK